MSGDSEQDELLVYGDSGANLRCSDLALQRAKRSWSFFELGTRSAIPAYSTRKVFVNSTSADEPPTLTCTWSGSTTHFFCSILQ